MFLVDKDENLPINGIDDCIRARCNLCCSELEARMTAELHGTKMNYVIPPSNIGSSSLTRIPWAFAQVKKGDCDAALISEDSYADREPVHDCEMMYVCLLA